MGDAEVKPAEPGLPRTTHRVVKRGKGETKTRIIVKGEEATLADALEHGGTIVTPTSARYVPGRRRRGQSENDDDDPFILPKIPKLPRVR